MDSNDFDYQGCLQWLDSAIKTYEQKQDLPTEEICKFLFEFTKIFTKMGKLLSMAFSDVTEKVEIMREKNKLYMNECEGMIFKIIKKEMSLGIHVLNSENNKKMTKNPDYLKYNSLSRNLLRMMWFQDFLKIMFEQLIVDKKQNSSKAFQKAYDEAFSKHHPFFIKAGASLAMSSAPKREKVFEYVVHDMNNQDLAYSTMQQLCDKINSIKTILWQFYQDNKLTELP